MRPDTQVLRLVGRRYCHLCDDMLIALQRLPEIARWEIEVIDVDEQPELLARFDEWVPVLLSVSGEPLCHYHLDVTKVRQYLGRFE